MDGTADAELDFAPGEVIGNFVGIPDGTGQAVKRGHSKRVTSAARGQGFAQARTILVRAGKPMINMDTFRVDTKGCEGITLRGEVLLFRGHSYLANGDLRHADQCAA